MSHSRIHIKATFVSTKAGKESSVFSNSPDDISERVGVIICKGYANLKTRLDDIISNIENEMYFHKDSHHVYCFDESLLQNGAIYGRKERRANCSVTSTKFTVSVMISIKSTAEFEKHMSDVAEVKRKRQGRNNQLSQVDSYTVELCVVLIKEKSRENVSVPTTLIMCDNAGVTSIRGSGGGLTSHRRNHAPSPLF